MLDKLSLYTDFSSFNINIVECKLQDTFNLIKERVRFNINIVECK